MNGGSLVIWLIMIATIMDIETTHYLHIQEDTLVTHYIPPGLSQANLSLYGSKNSHVTLQFDTQTMTQLQALINHSHDILTYLKGKKQAELNQQLSQLEEKETNGKELNSVPGDIPF